MPPHDGHGHGGRLTRAHFSTGLAVSDSAAKARMKSRALSGVLAFALLAPVAGVALSTWLLALLALYAAGNRWLPAALIACGLTLLLLALFVLGLQVPFQLPPPVLTPWLAGLANWPWPTLT